jgi:Flp pilus assembly protein TadD
MLTRLTTRFETIRKARDPRSRCRHNFLLAVAVLVFASAIAASAQDAATVEMIKKGALQMQSGKYSDAEISFREATRLSPTLAEPHLDLGLALVRQGKVEDATQELETARHLNPNIRGVNMFLGITYYQMHRLTDAIAALQREVEMNEQSADAQMWLGIAQLAAGNAQAAVGPLDRAAALSPNDLNILDYRGQAHGQVAKDSYAQMYKLDPKSWHVHRLQAELYAAQDRHKEAIAEFLEAIRAEPNNADLYEKLGEEYRKTSQLDLAHDAYEKELKLSPRNGIAMYNLGSIDIERDDAKAGVPLLEDAVKFYAEAPAVKYYLGRGLAQLGRNDEAIRYLEETVKAQPTGEIAKRAYYELSRIYRRTQQPAQAQRALAQYVKLKEEMDKQSAAQVEDWKKVNDTSAPTSAPTKTDQPAAQ